VKGRGGGTQELGLEDFYRYKGQMRAYEGKRKGYE
jgi:hypothetical protein